MESHNLMDLNTANLDLSRFLDAQEENFERALSEIKSGRKRTHWMWYVFPQLAGLGHSPTAQFYAIGSLAEAQAYLAHPLLGPRLIECCEATLQIEARTTREIFDSPDDLKLKSSATLFASISQPGSPFERLLEQFYAGERDARTLFLLAAEH